MSLVNFKTICENALGSIITMSYYDQILWTCSVSWAVDSLKGYTSTMSCCCHSFTTMSVFCESLQCVSIVPSSVHHVPWNPHHLQQQEVQEWDAKLLLPGVGSGLHRGAEIHRPPEEGWTLWTEALERQAVWHVSVAANSETSLHYFWLSPVSGCTCVLVVLLIICIKWFPFHNSDIDLYPVGNDILLKVNGIEVPVSSLPYQHPTGLSSLLCFCVCKINLVAELL